MSRKRRASGFEMRPWQNGELTVRRRNTLRFSALRLRWNRQPEREDHGRHLGRARTEIHNLWCNREATT
jgi:hypothetical protein